MHKALILLIAFLFVISGCGKFQRGDKFSSIIPGDSLQYVIIATGKGKKITEKAMERKMHHEIRGDSCILDYLTDSLSLQDKNALLLFNSMLPEIEDDILTKGFFGTFTSRQTVTLFLVSQDDFSRFFK